jgi:hypothetical protein
MRARRTHLTPALSLALGVAALLLFAWPLAREPRLPVLLALLHVLAAWAVIVVVLWWVSRLPQDDGSGAEDRDG